MGLDEGGGVGVDGDEVAHGGLEAGDGGEVAAGFLAVAGEERGNLGIGGIVGVPFGDEGASDFYVLFHHGDV